jgi:hypothetical protein
MNSTNATPTVLKPNQAQLPAAKLKWAAALVSAGVGSLALAVWVAEANEPGAIHYPDLQTLPPYDFKIQNESGTHRKLLRFSNAIANLGEGPMELIPHNDASTGRTDAYQSFYSDDESGNWHLVDSALVGSFVFHPQHDHWHFEDFARYELRNVASDGSVGDRVLSSNSKVSFCLTDSVPVNSSLEHAGPQTYDECTQLDPQGISVGWADVYSWNLYGQSLDITGLPSGQYWVVSTADPDNLIDEGSDAAESNNGAAVKIRIKGAKVTVIR